MGNQWDVIIVGARCAGASLATHLARRGVRTLMLDAATRGRDMPMSTHYVQPPGVAALDRLGLGDKVRAITPASKRSRIALDEAEAIIGNSDDQPAYCVRRAMLDPMLQQAAEDAGATFLDCHKVIGLERDGDRVTGVSVRTAQGEVTMHGDLVVGADGARSKVAELTGVEEYLVTHSSRAGYFGYYEAPPTWTNAWDLNMEHTGEELRSVFRCDSGLLCLSYGAPPKEVLNWGRDYKAKFHEALLASPATAALAEGKQASRTVGVHKGRFFYRRPVGPGFALIGDAGHFKDFVTGQGMTDAFLDAERMAKAILCGRADAFTSYWRERDAHTLPLHFDAVRQGALGYNSPFTRHMIDEFSRNPKLRERCASMLNRDITPGELVPGSILLKVVAKALLHGRFDVLGDFFKQGRVIGVENAELARAQKLALETAPLPDLPPMAASTAAA